MKGDFLRRYLLSSSVAEIQAFIWGGAGLRFSDKITSWIMSNFKETDLKKHILIEMDDFLTVPYRNLSRPRHNLVEERTIYV